tara:strand:- start:355 stop:633 length:279 start_codon:yes stop_codon:yes gene_type:complete
MKIGDKVIVTNPGKIYANYYEIFSELNFANQENNSKEDNYRQGLVYQVFGITVHHRTQIQLIAIECDDKQLLIEASALSKDTHLPIHQGLKK